MSLGIRPPVILIGSHRSGTSATARALRDLGLFTGQTSRSDYHGEAFFFIHLHDNYLQSQGATWFRPEPFLEKMRDPQERAKCAEYLGFHTNGRFGFGPLRAQSLARRFGEDRARDLMMGGLAWGWKDPRTTLFIDSWLKVFPQAKVLHIVRHPLDAALSLQKREERWKAEGNPLASGVLHDLDEAFNLVRRYVDYGVAVDKHPHYREVRFEDLQDNPDKILSELAEFCEIKPSASQLKEIAGTIEGDRRARWRDLPAEDVVRYMSTYPYAARFQYEATLVER